ncbi:uncharacterized protein [Asterias amurensis]|uniref:uncharacterized protein n=1 Tax=Asterias amurensis TaxID=7602 RepID=UPI003AB8A814
MKQMIISVFASFVFILMSYKVHAIDQYQNVLPNYDLSDGRQQLNGELSRPNNRDYMPGRQQALGNNNVGAKVDYQLKLNAQRLQRQQAQANQQQERNGVYKEEANNMPSRQQKKPDYSAIKYKQTLDEKAHLIKRINEIEVIPSGDRPDWQKRVLEQLRDQLKELKHDEIKSRGYLLEKYYGRYFSKDDDKIEFKLPAKPLKNCVLQAMVDPTFSPSCNSNRTYQNKQCTKKRCWCSTKTGTLVKLRDKRGNSLHGDGFYYGIKGLTLRCPRNYK